MRGRGNTNTYRNKVASGRRLEGHRPRHPKWRNDGSDPANGTPDAVEQTFAWGPDLSSTEQGAGGIGGLAVMLDDSFELGGGSGAVGHMFPIYDGNGNIVKVYSTEIQQDLMTSVAEYRYGPFGEQRGQSGSMATRLPFRWSTKFTDNETALVYYGYRYYSGSLGRWVSRDLIGELDSANSTLFCNNSPLGSTDSFGLWTRNADFVGTHGHQLQGLVTSECGDTYEHLAWLITGRPEDAAAVGLVGKPSLNDVVDVGDLLELFDQRVRMSTVAASRLFVAPFTGVGDITKGMSEAEIDRYFDGSKKSAVDCSNGAHAVLRKGLIDVLRSSGQAGEYDLLFKGRSVFLDNRSITGESDLIPGDLSKFNGSGHFRRYYSDAIRLARQKQDKGALDELEDDLAPWGAEHVIYRGRGRYWGHGMPHEFGAQEVVNDLHAKNMQLYNLAKKLGATYPRAPVPGDIVGISSTVATSWDIGRIATAIFDQRRKSR